MRSRVTNSIRRTLVAGSALLAAAAFALPQSAQAQDGRGRYNRVDQRMNRRDERRDDRYTYGRIVFDWDLNGFQVRDRAALEAQLRRDLNDNAGSRYVGRRENSNGTLEVNVEFKRVNSNTVRAEVRLGLNRDGRGAAGVTATESANIQSRDNRVDGSVVLDAFHKARREFTAKVNQYSRDNR